MSECDSTTPAAADKSAKPSKPYTDFPSFRTPPGAGPRRSRANSTTSARGPTPTPR